MRNNRAIALLLVCLVAAQTVRADDPAALAESLFEEGRRLGFEQGNWREACPKFAESHRIHPGGGVVLNLAHCYRMIGKTASAYARYKEGLALAIRDNNASRIKLANEAIAELEPQLSHLTLTVPPSADVSDLAVRLDDRPVPRAAWGVKIAVDPGVHAVVASAPNRQEHRVAIEIGDAEAKTVEIAPLAALPSPAKDAPLPRLEDPDRTRRIVGLAIAGVGVFGLGLGTYFGVRALHARDESRALGCVAGSCKDPGASELSHDAVRFGNLSTVSFGVGVLGAAIGGYLFVTAPKAPRPSVAFDDTQLRIALTATF